MTAKADSLTTVATHLRLLDCYELKLVLSSKPRPLDHLNSFAKQKGGLQSPAARQRVTYFSSVHTLQ